MHWNSKKIFILSASLWGGAGVLLLSRGVHYMAQVASVSDNEQYPLLLVVLALFVGFVKGRWVLAKTARRMIAKVEALQAPFRFSQAYGRKELVLIVMMIGLGRGMQWLSVPASVRGFICMAVGSALIHAALFYVRREKQRA